MKTKLENKYRLMILIPTGEPDMIINGIKTTPAEWVEVDEVNFGSKKNHPIIFEFKLVPMRLEKK